MLQSKADNSFANSHSNRRNSYVFCLAFVCHGLRAICKLFAQSITLRTTPFNQTFTVGIRWIFYFANTKSRSMHRNTMITIYLEINWIFGFWFSRVVKNTFSFIVFQPRKPSAHCECSTKWNRVFPQILCQWKPDTETTHIQYYMHR